jgi:large subunit ribosomal protein L23
MKIDPHGILHRPVITEKSTAGVEHKNAYVFQVDPKANKLEIKRAVEEVFNVKVIKVNTRRQIGKNKRMGWITGFTQCTKEAIVTLRVGDKIDIY